MHFSVVITTYNRLQLLARTLESVWRQRYLGYEVIVVDDGSDDGTCEYLENLGDKIRYIRQRNRGPGAARNVGIQKARGDYIALLDSDDLWFSWSLDVFAHAIQEHRQPCIVGGNLVEFKEESELLTIREDPYKTLWFKDYIAASYCPYYVGSGTSVLRRDALTGITFLEDRLNAEDHDLTLQIGNLPGFARVISPHTLAWRRHSASETNNCFGDVAGARRLLAREKMGAYPGGAKRSRERHRILARHIRPTALACVRRGELKDGWQLYRAIFCWNVALGHWKYVLALPILTTLSLLKRAIRRIPRVAS
jgi:glycosyltransferase involved in cell wall biosynthesis